MAKPTKKSTTAAATATKKVTATTSKSAAKKVAAKKTVTRKAAVKKTVAAKSTAPKKTAPGRVAKRASGLSRKGVVKVVARADVGFGNELHIRGEGAGLSWDWGVPMENNGPDEWLWQGETGAGAVEFKLLLNDTHWALGENLTVKPGGSVVVEPKFQVPGQG